MLRCRVLKVVSFAVVEGSGRMVVMMCVTSTVSFSSQQCPFETERLIGACGMRHARAGYFSTLG